MSRRSLWLPLVLVAACDSPPQRNEAAPDTTPVVAADTAPRVLFAVRRNDHGIWMDAVAVFHDTGIARPPAGEWRDSAANAFRARWYAPGLRYFLHSANGAIGHIAAVRATEPGCAGLPADARLLDLDSLARPALATNALRPGAGPIYLRPVTAEEQALLDTVAFDAIPDSVPRILRIRTHRTQAFAVAMAPGRPLLLGSYESEVEDRRLSVLVVLEHDQRYRPTLTDVRDGIEAGVEIREFYDILDVTGDRLPEIITANRYYQSTGYSIYARAADGWREIYTGGGGGC